MHRSKIGTGPSEHSLPVTTETILRTYQSGEILNKDFIYTPSTSGGQQQRQPRTTILAWAFYFDVVVGPRFLFGAKDPTLALSNLIGLGYSRRSAFWQRTVLTVRRGVCRLG